MDKNQHTLRLAGLPALTRQSDVRYFFGERLNRRSGGQIIEAIGPICDHASRQTKRTTVSFSSRDLAEQALNLPESKRRLSAEQGGAEIISIDASFKDLTTLYSADNPSTGKPDVDIVALHGLNGHAWNSFASSDRFDEASRRIKETNWLRDILPRLLQDDRRHSIYTRVMTYGFNASVWMTSSVADIDVPVDNLLSSLESERNNDPSRPLFFVAYSLGGVVTKQAIIQIANTAIQQSLQASLPSVQRYNFPVKGCMFFGVPGRGTEVADKASKFLQVLSTVFNVNTHVVSELGIKSQKLANIGSEFRTIRAEHKIPVISFFETVKYNHKLGVIVDKESAFTEYEGCPRPFGIDRNHKDMITFKDDDSHALEAAIQFLAQFAHQALEQQASRSRPLVPLLPLPPVFDSRSTQENKWSKLRTYDTVFLIDDSPSMANGGWDLVDTILEYSIPTTTQYDPNGIDIHFLNNIEENADNVRDPYKARSILRSVSLFGSTPIFDQLQRHLRSYLFNYKKHQGELSFKGYNLIVLTDGEPDPDSEDEADISDQEDARKNSAAYRMIRKEIVDTVRELDRLGAPKAQVGIQFCQIGDKDNVQEFFAYLDDRIKGKYKLGRDMVDTVRCLSYEDLTEDFFEKLLMGAINKKLDHLPQKVHGQNTYNDERPAIQPRQPEHGFGLNTRQSFPAQSPTYSPHEPHDGNFRARPHGDPGEGPSTGHSRSDPEITTRQSIVQSLNADSYGSNNYTSFSVGGDGPTPVVPSPRVVSFPTTQHPLPDPGLLRSSTEQVATVQAKGKWSFRR